MTKPIPGQPMFKQIAKILRERITDGTYPVGSVIPSGEAMSEEFGVSRATITQALTILRNERLIQPRHGQGTVVRARKKVGASDPLLAGITGSEPDILVQVQVVMPPEWGGKLVTVPLMLPADATIPGYGKGPEAMLDYAVHRAKALLREP